MGRQTEDRVEQPVFVRRVREGPVVRQKTRLQPKQVQKLVIVRDRLAVKSEDDEEQKDEARPEHSRRAFGILIDLQESSHRKQHEKNLHRNLPLPDLGGNLG